MHPTVVTGAPNLNISIAAPPAWTYLAGDTIIGSVNRSSHLVAPDAKITLVLIGHAKARLISDGYPHKSTYYGDWDLFKPPRQVLLRGPIHIPEPSVPTDWINIPFSLKIPRTTPHWLLGNHAQTESFLPLGTSTRHPLPATYATEWPGAKICIEYYLQAKLQYMRKGLWRVQRATAPIRLGHPTVDADEIRFALQRCSITSRVRSQRLLPSMQGVDLTLTQKTQKLLGLSMVPGYCFEVVMWVPVAIQLENPAPIPLCVSVIPQRDGTSGVIRDVVQRVRIVSIKMTLLSEVEIVVKPSEAGFFKLPKDGHIFAQNLGLEKVFKQLKIPIVAFAGENDRSVDIGAVVRLVLGRDGLRSDGRRLSPLNTCLQPSFVTFNTRLSHSILWHVSLNIAGETRTVMMKTSVIVYNSVLRP
ncbi:uncharacterized protein N7515_007754 [Penicillium bovifimosum]|uniref:Arrestin-like N-terminal domain-containing protein n=1 Tax=Penicillium bovifimosum TaxID=126998 RepID=A0A9W9GM57_9EURO|nr:uncharacterized protein N7515_007754 [Penicillium bovifimosum]KAJ5123929.1 hypothetical protein N7515_007754 [Penicillium bovifimosum]